MAPLPEDNTGRMYWHYHANGNDHTVTARYSGTETPPGTAVEDFAAIIDGFSWAMPNDWAFISAEYSVQGSNVRLPLDFPLVEVSGAQDTLAAAAPAYVSIPGRSAGGRRWRITMLGTTYNPFLVPSTTADYRLTTAENSNVAALVVLCSGTALRAIDELAFFPHSYANLGFHRHWQDAVRG